MKRQLTLTGNELKQYIIKEAKNKLEVVKKRQRIKKLNEQSFVERVSDKITENMMRKMGLKKSKKLTENINENLWAEIRFVQSGDEDYDKIEEMFCGKQDGYCEANSQPVIDYLSQWDGEETELTTNQPRIARYDTSYKDEKGVYTLLYNSTIGGCFLLYRPATDQEIDWYNDKGPGSMGESKMRNLKENVSYNDYATISEELESMGWGYSDCYDVKNSKTGQTGIRYVLTHSPKSADVEEMKNKMTGLLGKENVVFSTGQHRYAPELTNISMIVLDNDTDTENDPMSESKNRLHEGLYDKQWEEEINIFLKGLKTGQALVDNNYVAVEWGHNETDPRYIVYYYGDNRLTDDHFSQQHSRVLSDKEIRDIYWLLKNKYGMDKDDTLPEEYYNVDEE